MSEYYLNSDRHPNHSKIGFTKLKLRGTIEMDRKTTTDRIVQSKYFSDFAKYPNMGSFSDASRLSLRLQL